MKLTVDHDAALPRLGWVARIDSGTGAVHALAGHNVEVGERSLVEGTWPGRFDGTGFATSESFFGTGLKVEDEAVLVVPSCSLTDRVWLARPRHPSGVRVALASNSLLLLLGALGERLDADTDYRPACHAVLAGVDDYVREFPSPSPDYTIEQLYLHPVRVSREDARVVPRDHTTRFASFEAYESCLLNTVGGIVDNCYDGTRRHAVEPVAATSTGYDSTAVASLAREHGVGQVWATDGAVTLDGAMLEDATTVTEALDVKTHVLEPRRPAPNIERLCLAATYDGRESIFTSLFDESAASLGLTGLFSGYHGDKIWDRATTGIYLDRTIRRGDTSGVNLAEVRLHCGLFNISIPFVQARNVADIVAISNSREMSPWQLGTDYDRPIPRRIAESRGVPREAFGVGKTQVMEYYTWPRDPSLREDLFAYLDSQGFGRLRRKGYQLAELIDYRMTLRGFAPTRDARARLRPGARNLENTVFLWAVNGATQAQADASPALGALLSSKAAR